jgi:hypothetical protein
MRLIVIRNHMVGMFNPYPCGLDQVNPDPPILRTGWAGYGFADWASQSSAAS